MSSCVIDVMDHGKVMDEQNYKLEIELYNVLYTGAVEISLQLNSPGSLKNIVDMIREKKLNLFFILYLKKKRGRRDMCVRYTYGLFMPE